MKKKNSKKRLSGRAGAARPAKRAASSRNKVTLSRRVQEAVSDFFTNTPNHIVDAIKQDHSDLKKLIKSLKDGSLPLSERRVHYKKFETLLKSHSVAEEQAVYKNSKNADEKEIRLETDEGIVEHQVADMLMERIATLSHSEKWTAHTKVLAEMVEHHIKEEEAELLPDLKKTLDKEANAEMLNTFLLLRQTTQQRPQEANSGVLATL